MKCPNCQKESPQDSRFCSFCGSEMTQEKPKKNNNLQRIALLAICVVGMVLTVILFSGNNKKSAEKPVIPQTKPQTEQVNTMPVATMPVTTAPVSVDTAEVSTDFIGSWFSYTGADGEVVEWHVVFQEDGDAMVTLGFVQSEYIAWFDGRWSQDTSDPSVLTLNLTGGDLENGERKPNTKHAVRIKVTLDGDNLKMSAVEGGEDVYILYDQWYKRNGG